MLELYSSAIDKIRRIDALKEELRKLKGEDGKLSSSVTVYRKKNDWREKDGNDGAITKINELRADVSKREALAKAEIKSLRAEVYDILSICFVGAKTEEHRAKIREACLYASDGAAMISQTGNIPSAFVKCKIVGSRATHDITLDGTVEKIIRAGIKNTSGRFIILPEIVVYHYDENSVEGEYTVLNERYPKETKKPSEPSKVDETPTVDYIEDVETTAEETYPMPADALDGSSSLSANEEPTKKTKEKHKKEGGNFSKKLIKEFSGKNSLIALCFAIVFAGFYLTATILKVASGSFGDKIWKFAVCYFAFSFVKAFSVSVSLEKPTNGNLFALFSLYGGVLSAFTLFLSEAVVKSFAFPLAMLLSGIILLLVDIADKEEKKKIEFSVASYILAGVILALAIYNIYNGAVSADNTAQEIFAFVAFCFVACLGFILLVTAFLSKGYRDIAYSLFGFTAFCVVTALCLEKAISVIILGVLFAISGIVRINKTE